MDWYIKVLILGVHLAVVAYFLFGKGASKGGAVLKKMKVKLSVAFPNTLDVLPEGETDRKTLYLRMGGNETRLMRFCVRCDESSITVNSILGDTVQEEGAETPLILVVPYIYGREGALDFAVDACPVSFEAGETCDVWLGVTSSAEAGPGVYTGKAVVNTDKGEFYVPYNITVSELVSENIEMDLSCPEADYSKGYAAARLWGMMKAAEAEGVTDVPLAEVEESSYKGLALCEGLLDGGYIKQYEKRISKKIETLGIESEVSVKDVLRSFTDQLYQTATVYENENERIITAVNLLRDYVVTPSPAVVTVSEPEFVGSRYECEFTIYAPLGSTVIFEGKQLIPLGKRGNAAVYAAKVRASVGSNFYSVTCNAVETNHMVAIMRPVIFEDEEIIAEE